MLISLAKQGDLVVLMCTRRDGSVTWQKSGHDGFFGRHDLLHFAVETTLGLRESFFGMVAAGQSIESFAAPGAAATLPAEALHTEMMVNQLMIEHNFGEAADAASFNKVMAACWAGSMHRNAPSPRALTDEQLSMIRAKYGELVAAWDTLPSGQKLELQFGRESE